MSTERISWTSSTPTTEFITYCDRISQSVSGNYTTIRLIIKAYNRGSSSSWTGSGGYHHAWVSGSDYNTQDINHNPSSNFLPSGYSTGELRWSYQRDINIKHNSDGTRGAVTLNQHVNFDGQDSNKDYSFNDFPDIDVNTVPDAPTALAMSQITDNSMLFDMNQNDTGGLSITNAQVRWGTDPNAVGASTTTGLPSYYQFTIGGLKRNTLYYFWGRIYNSKGWSAWSNRVSATTLADQPGVPTPIALDSATQSSLRYRFSDPADNGGASIDDRQIGYGTDPNNVQTTISSNGDSTLTGLSRYTTYYVWSRVHTSWGWSNWSARSQLATLAYVPGAPTPTALDTVTMTSVHYKFADNGDNGGAGVDSRQIGYGTDPNNVQTTISSDGDDTITGLSPGTTYYFWSRTHNVQGWSNWSSSMSARTPAGARVRVVGVYRDAIPWVRVAGVWKMAQPWVNKVGTWKKTG